MRASQLFVGGVCCLGLDHLPADPSANADDGGLPCRVDKKPKAGANEVRAAWNWETLQ
jgi:hypothetical protein